MNVKRFRTLAVFVGALALAAGCSDNDSVSPVSNVATELTDEQEIEAIISAEDVDVFTDDVFAGWDESSLAIGVEGGANLVVPIDADRWRRIFERTEVVVTKEFPGDGTALVTWTASLEGVLRIGDFDDSTGSFTTYEKDIAGTLTRRALFVRHERDERWPSRRWHLEAVSFAVHESDPAPTMAIESVEITNLDSGFSRTYTDPYALLDVETELPEFEAGERVQVTVTVSDPDVLAFLHNDGRRLPMDAVEAGVFQGTYTVPARPGRHHAAVDVLASETLLDSDGAYDSVAWGTVYRVAGDRPFGGYAGNGNAYGRNDGRNGHGEPGGSDGHNGQGECDQG